MTFHPLRCRRRRQTLGLRDLQDQLLIFQSLKYRHLFTATQQIREILLKGILSINLTWISKPNASSSFFCRSTTFLEKKKKDFFLVVVVLKQNGLKMSTPARGCGDGHIVTSLPRCRRSSPTVTQDFINDFGRTSETTPIKIQDEEEVSETFSLHNMTSLPAAQDFFCVWQHLDVTV